MWAYVYIMSFIYPILASSLALRETSIYPHDWRFQQDRKGRTRSFIEDSADTMLQSSWSEQLPMSSGSVVPEGQTKVVSSSLSMLTFYSC